MWSALKTIPDITENKDVDVFTGIQSEAVHITKAPTEGDRAARAIRGYWQVSSQHYRVTSDAFSPARASFSGNIGMFADSVFLRFPNSRLHC